MKVLAFDPGKVNFAHALIVDKRCVTHGHVTATITDLTYGSLNDQMQAFASEMAAVFDAANLQAKRDWFAFERMQHRPNMGGGAVVEYINLMIGMCLAEARARQLNIYPVMPTTWKSHFIREFGIEKKRFTMAAQKLALPAPAGSGKKTRLELVPGLLTGSKATALTPHEGDAIGIGCYVWQQLSGLSIVRDALT